MKKEILRRFALTLKNDGKSYLEIKDAIKKRFTENSVGCVTFKQNCLDREFRTKYDLIIRILCNFRKVLVFAITLTHPNI